MARARKHNESKGIFCLETHTWGGVKDQTSVEPILQMLTRMSKYKVQHVHHSVATWGDFKHCLEEYCKSGKGGFDTYPILNLSFHGEGGDNPGIRLGNGEFVTLDTIGEHLAGRCENRVIYFGSCSTMDVDARRLKNFLKNTKALAVCGYRENVDWLFSAAFEILILGSLQNVDFTLHGIRDFQQTLQTNAKKLYNTLGFRLIERTSKAPPPS